MSIAKLRKCRCGRFFIGKPGEELCKVCRKKTKLAEFKKEVKNGD